MGHERVGTLPRTQRWRAVIDALDATIRDDGTGGVSTHAIAALTLEAARGKIGEVQRDAGVARSFQFLLLLSVAGQADDPRRYLEARSVTLPDQVTPLALSVALRTWLQPIEFLANPEYATLARQATTDTIAEWHRAHTTGQRLLLAGESDPFESWRRAGQGAGFSELSRTFFAKFTGRYLNYFLSRAASATLSTTSERDRFGAALDRHVDAVAQHAFETSKITQSFAAGWFNKNALRDLPSEEKVSGFVSFAFGKIREELRREGTA